MKQRPTEMDAGFPHLALITHSISAARRPAASHTSFSKYTRLHATFIHLAEVNEMDGDGGEGDERCEVIALDVAVAVAVILTPLVRQKNRV